VPFNLAAVLSDLARLPDLAGPCVAVVALAADKDASGFLTELRKHASGVVFTTLPSSNRGRPAPELHQLAQTLGLTSEVEPDPHMAFRWGCELARKADAWLLVTGSLYLVGELRGEALGGER
jgi:dihydrofolate synthase/folylpolyglutamate synthase